LRTKNSGGSGFIKKYRRLTGVWASIIRWLAIGMSLYQLYTAIFGVLPAQLQRTWHLGFALSLIFLLS
jgi:TRAP-type uncharacterized transport system fused permease subunit